MFVDACIEEIMYFVDEAKIKVRSGRGGDGCISFRREKFVPKGGPSGGDGGKGGDVYLRASSKLFTLYDFRLKSSYNAEKGGNGEGKDKHGRSGKDQVIDVPVGTRVYTNESGETNLWADLTVADEIVLVARGGKGGKGNIHFKTSVNRAPREAESGEDGEERQFFLELRIIADAGIIGLPNAGKSTFLSTVSRARPEIASYPFTTLNPQLGVVIDDIGNQRVLADMPGLIEGAHSGRGLGDTFLKHASRTKFLVHMLSSEDINLDDPWAGFQLVNQELQEFDPELANKKQLKVLSKIDLLGGEAVKRLRNKARQDNIQVLFLSALEKIGIEEFLEYFWEEIKKQENSL